MGLQNGSARNEVYQAVIPGERRNGRGLIDLAAPEEPEFDDPRKKLKVKVKVNNEKEREDAKSETNT